MNITRQKVGLSFSIENILRDDFCHSRRTNTNVESRETYFAAECWPTSPAYTCYAVPYGPMFMKYLPTTNRLNVGVRLHRVNGENDHFLAEQTRIIDDDCISCKNEETYSDNHDSGSDKELIQEKSVKCFNENGPKRKRRNRSHFTQRQLQYLEKIFSRQQYLTRDERTLLARGLEMTELQIRNWFQNRRYQRRHRANEDNKQQEPDTSVPI
ncbi:unnamed protein product [Porites evermanni]|uniref:Homeobox domain-containing protein n=1 Tax=Porites evermanni TaxID=104178 RepID=A0ABN8MCG5_9CNID|nr:unnamed protein product [Porites evermanni]